MHTFPSPPDGASEAMAAYGVPETDIATVIGIDPETLRKHYRDELDTGSIKVDSRIAESLYRKAMGDGPQSVTACIFWLKTRARWKETPVEEAKASDYPSVIFRTIVEPPPRDAEARPVGRPVPVRQLSNTSNECRCAH